MKVDYLVDRAKLKKSLGRWKIASLSLFFALLLLTFGNGIKFIKKDYIARIPIEGVIYEDLHSVDVLKDVAKDKHIKAVILYINSPGGTTTGGESMYRAIKKISAVKPVVTVMGGSATSGAYMASLGGQYIIAHHTTITGSIGVLLQSFEITEIAEKLGIKFKNYKSSLLKASPLPTEKASKQSEIMLSSLIKNQHKFFTSLVAENRKISGAKLRIVTNGAVYTGKQALDSGLIDALGDEDTALQWLQKEKGLPNNLEIVELEIKRPTSKIDEFINSRSDILFLSLENIQYIASRLFSSYL